MPTRSGALWLIGLTLSAWLIIAIACVTVVVFFHLAWWTTIAVVGAVIGLCFTLLILLVTFEVRPTKGQQDQKNQRH